MENASKALLIAAAILIVILIIAVAMLVFNGASDTIDAGIDQMGSQEISMFNSQFTQYLGNGISASNVRSLLAAIEASNGANATHQVTPTGITTANGITAGQTYNVTATYGTGTGYITEIAISLPT